MNCRDFQQDITLMAARHEVGSSASIPHWKRPVVCPRPRRIGLVTGNPSKLSCSQMSHKIELSDPNLGAELLDIIGNKERFGAEQFATPLSSSPPFFSGSPPRRTTNPLTQDLRFGDEKFGSISKLSILSPFDLISPSPSSSAHEGGCTWKKFGHQPAAVRVEGFDCLGRDHQHSSITAVA